MTGTASTETVDALVLDLLEWIGPGDRPYDEVLEAWRTSCPRLPVWEEAHARGLLLRRREPGGGDRISLSPAGAALVAARRPSAG
jgi:D-3-phosphoglycerate dehydrogenase